MNSPLKQYTLVFTPCKGFHDNLPFFSRFRDASRLLAQLLAALLIMLQQACTVLPLSDVVPGSFGKHGGGHLVSFHWYEVPGYISSFLIQILMEFIHGCMATTCTRYKYMFINFIWYILL